MVNGALTGCAMIFACAALVAMIIAVCLDRRDAPIWWAWAACLALGAVLAYVCAQVITW